MLMSCVTILLTTLHHVFHSFIVFISPSGECVRQSVCSTLQPDLWPLPSALCRLPRVLPALGLSAAAALLPGLHADDPHRRPRGRPARSGAGPHGLLRQRQPGHVCHRRQVGGAAAAPRRPWGAPGSDRSCPPSGVFQTTASTAAAARRPGMTSAATAAALATPAPPATLVSTCTCSIQPAVHLGPYCR